MATTSAGWLLNSLRLTSRHVTGCNIHPSIFLQTRDYAARKGTREKARKKKVKKEVIKVGFIPHNLRPRRSGEMPKVIQTIKFEVDDTKKPKPIDNVWFVQFHQWKVFSFQEAIENHREVHHPTMYNMPDTPVKALVELNMQGEKKTKFLNNLSIIIGLPYAFDNQQDRSVLAFSKNTEYQMVAKEAGANFVGGIDLIKTIQGGEFSVKEYDYVVAHTDIISDLLLIRGLLKKNFPNPKLGTLTDNMKETVEKFKYGTECSAIVHATKKEYAKMHVPIGTLDMDVKQLEANFSTIIKSLEAVKPRRTGQFILRARITCPHSPEQFKIDVEKYLPSKVVQEVEEEDNSNAIIATN